MIQNTVSRVFCRTRFEAMKSRDYYIPDIEDYFVKVAHTVSSQVSFEMLTFRGRGAVFSAC